ncbi:MAG: hypothetical protein IJG36_08100 [Synergistaceae bacterium]|nr:hypothetical protein [Synergistaceae bacterium]
MTEKSENLNAKLEIYLTLLRATPATKQRHKQAISEFLALLLERGRNIPVEDDYNDYRYHLRIKEHQSISATESAISCINRFFYWLAENPDCTDINTATIPKNPNMCRSRRVSAVISPYLFESLTLISEHDGVDIPAILNALVMNYVTYRKKDIPALKEKKISPNKFKSAMKALQN